MRNRVLAEHLLQVSLGWSRGCPAHPAGSGQAVKSKGLVKCINANTNYLQRQKKTFAIPDPLLPLHGNDVHHPRDPRADPHTRQTKSAFPRKSVCRLMLKDWGSLSCAGWLWTHAQQTACCKPCLPSAPEPEFTWVTPGACISGCIFWSFPALKAVPVMSHGARTADCRSLLLARQSPSHCSFQSCTGGITPPAMSSMWSHGTPRSRFY